MPRRIWTKKALFVAAALLLILMIGSSSAVQGQTPVACNIEGPSVADTIAYITTALDNAPAVPYSNTNPTFQRWSNQFFVSPDGTEDIHRPHH